ncbi:MAG: hypothetical protein ISR76_01610 [Planctomycetes bacterium]|nr:hypothetical protein [Planctomycetota bacterium]MBL7007666.1 hypothetical protein [Planctomycetota bacterium]
MERRPHLPGLLALSLLALPLLAAMNQDPAGHDADETPLMLQMQVLKSGMKGLRRSLRDPQQNDASLEVVLEMQAASQLAKVEPPQMAAQVPEAERPAFVAAYRMEMVETQKVLLDLELALLASDSENAQAIYQRLKALEEEGHEHFTVE